MTLKEHSPTRNQLPWKTHDKTKKTQKLKKTLDLSASRWFSPGVRLDAAQGNKGKHLSKTKQKQKSAIRTGPNRCWNDVAFVSENGIFLYARRLTLNAHVSRFLQEDQEGHDPLRKHSTLEPYCS